MTLTAAAAHELCMQKMTDARPQAPARPNVRRRRAVIGGSVLAAVGFALGIYQWVIGNTTTNGLFFAVLFSLAAGGWILFSAVMDSREESNDQ